MAIIFNEKRSYVMGKYYVLENVLLAAEKRLIYIFERFDYVYFSLSGGKVVIVLEIFLANRGFL